MQAYAEHVEYHKELHFKLLYRRGTIQSVIKLAIKKKYLDMTLWSYLYKHFLKGIVHPTNKNVLNI